MHEDLDIDAIVDGCQDASLNYRTSLGEAFDRAPAVYAEGRAWELAGRPERALDAFRRALHEPTAQPWPRLLNAVLGCAQAAGRVTETADWLRTRALAQPPLPELLVWAGVLLRLDGQLEPSLGVLEAAIVRNHEPVVRYTATTERIRVLAGLGRLEDALKACEAAIDELPDYGDLLRISLAGLMTSSGRHPEALAEIEQVLEETPDSGDAHLNRGVILLRLGRRIDAEQAFAKAVACDPRLAGQAEALLRGATPPTTAELT